MDVSDEECINLIHLYKLRPILWDPTNPTIWYGKEKTRMLVRNITQYDKRCE